jgi:1-hydroxycarotenoid 3,4-desaturase
MGAGSHRIVVIGAGMGGLAAALLLAARGRQVLVLDRAATPGGKIREVTAGGAAIGAGPALLTMRPVFESLFAAAGTTLETEVTLRRETLLGRHLWSDGAGLDLPADPAAAAEAIGAFAGPAAARGYQAFLDKARRVHDALEAPYLTAQRPSALQLAASAGLKGLLGTAPFATLWDALGEHFAHPRLRQVFARLATYVGSSPLQAPATLMLIAHVEQQGLWAVQGGLQRLVEALVRAAERLGVTFRFGAEVAAIRAGTRVQGVTLSDGEAIEARTVLANADLAALGAGRFGAAAAKGVGGPLPAARRSFSAVTWALRARVEGTAPARHTVAHPDDPLAEYADLGPRARLPAAPTVTLWAQDREDGAPPPEGAERLLVMVNAPARADLRRLPPEALAACTDAAFGALARAGMSIEREGAVVTGPAEFEGLFPGTGGALYGPAAQGWQAAFSRPGARTALPGLYVAGGGTHPGAGVAMAAISGRLAAERIIGDGG